MKIKFEIEIDTNDCGDMQSVEELIEIIEELKSYMYIDNQYNQD
jgi:hypothetical protein